jgi:ribosomal protein S18 acetylase RimI-like enzyme
VNRTQALLVSGRTTTGRRAVTAGPGGDPDYAATTGRAGIVVRPARPDDAAAIRDFFTGLSVRARYLRFFAAITPTPAMVRVLAGDGASIHPVVAVHDSVIIGHAMAVDRPEPGASTTDIGVAVAGFWQGQGVGSELVRALIRGAQDRGVRFISMDVLPGNHQVLGMIRGHWPAARIVASQDCLTIRAPLPRQHGRPRSQRGHEAARRHRPGEQHGAPALSGTG